MFELDLSILMAGLIAGAAPIVLAALGETVTEKAGVINLSLDGSILLSAMVAFVVALKTGSTLTGFCAAALVGAVVALTVGIFSIYLKQSQVAVGFVLTLMCRDLAYFWGNPYARMQGPQVDLLAVPGLAQIPFIGPILFQHSYPVYFSLIAIVLVWWYLYHTAPGLILRAVGENPRAVYARGFNPRRLQLIYVFCGGLLVGLAGAAFSLAVKPGWGRPQGAEGTGWIALALVIFGGWHPLRAAAGAYLFSFLQVSGIYLQGWFPAIPAQVFQVAPFPLMIFTLVLMHWGQKDPEVPYAAKRRSWRNFLRLFTGKAPKALGKSFHSEA
jgi:simple sugar transport system permease protein